jgi:hypothetical protein
LYNTGELEANQQEDKEVYYKEPNLSGGIEVIDYIIGFPNKNVCHIALTSKICHILMVVVHSLLI